MAPPPNIDDAAGAAVVPSFCPKGAEACAGGGAVLPNMLVMAGEILVTLLVPNPENMPALAAAGGPLFTDTEDADDEEGLEPPKMAAMSLD